ncbi:glucose-6-Phosphate 1-dehydrogenase [Arthrobacter sp. Hiyo6]|nr:glucose-6-Phosphate 1-dehydrogenase [Arthrobacter sp. Hiyo6]
MRIGFGPDTLQFDVDVNGPGNVLSLDRATLTAELSASDLLPYGEVLEGVLMGDPLLSVRADTAEDCWRILDPVIKAGTGTAFRWRSTPPVPRGLRAGPPRFHPEASLGSTQKSGPEHLTVFGPLLLYCLFLGF